MYKKTSPGFPHHTPTLYERLGGDAVVESAVSNFFDEMCEDPELHPFFQDISVSAMCIHQIKFFRLIFGAKEDKPDQDEMLYYMLATHTRLFRDQGLNEEHFDKVVNSVFDSSLRTLSVDEQLIEECKAVLKPMRAAFEHGAKVAAMEKSYTIEQVRMLPTTTPSHFGTDELSILPDPTWIDIPAWLPETLDRYSSNGVVRAWTRDLIDRFGADGDQTIADTFMDMPFMSCHPYAAAILQLAFLPEGTKPNDLLQVVKYPRGPEKGSIVQALWDRMVTQFQKTCDSMRLQAHITRQAVETLTGYRDAFKKGSIRFVGGVTAPHVLQKNVIHCAEFDVSVMHKKKGRKLKSISSVTKSSSSSESVSATSDSSSSDRTGKTKKGVWRRMFGWSNKAH